MWELRTVSVLPEDSPLSSALDTGMRANAVDGLSLAVLLYSIHCTLTRILPMPPRIPPSLAGGLLLSAALFAPVAGLAAQQPAAAPAPPTPEVGSMAPDFTIAGATRYGLLRDSVRLSDFRGQTVVLAFFFQARTKG